MRLLPSVDPSHSQSLALESQTKGNRTIFLEDGLHVATVIRQGATSFWWCVAFTGGHTGSRQEAELKIREELSR